MVKMKCSGWWEQQGYGRQSMDDLELSFENGHVRGIGTDIVGDFVFSGVVNDQGIHLHKQYVGQHSIKYHGTYDGEGVYFGRWDYAGYLGGNWLIRVGVGRPSVGESEAEIIEL